MFAVRPAALPPAQGCPAPLPKKSNKYSFLLQAFFSSGKSFFAFGAVFVVLSRTRRRSLLAPCGPVRAG